MNSNRVTNVEQIEKQKSDESLFQQSTPNVMDSENANAPSNDPQNDSDEQFHN